MYLSGEREPRRDAARSILLAVRHLARLPAHLSVLPTAREGRVVVGATAPSPRRGRNRPCNKPIPQSRLYPPSFPEHKRTHYQLVLSWIRGVSSNSEGHVCIQCTASAMPPCDARCYTHLHPLVLSAAAAPRRAAKPRPRSRCPYLCGLVSYAERKASVCVHYAAVHIVENWPFSGRSSLCSEDLGDCFYEPVSVGSSSGCFVTSIGASISPKDCGYFIELA